MYNQILQFNNIYSFLVNNTLIDMTINNPIFVFAIITVIWFIPGIIVRRVNEQKQIKRKQKLQDDAIKKLYPKPKD
ncbi:hypothetical protein [Prochlorococcus marinus]|uniref:Uncharacterized protein n=1 Tax=Prochlorococcus marinus XMU1408 TaxID=2213228 RepID=A0A318RE29_PROMR|nr:hypothetical protein [Prochlorococcus marinus]MBW3042233.1 hypothetical protein [Prochlorococcus marinus str. XMU1408]PYE01625.1 hypothetical protein DNJ73_05945 [Prochlorococcus marinus XMU1408]